MELSTLCVDAAIVSFEPMSAFVLARLPNLIATQHIGGRLKKARRRMGETAILGLVDYFMPYPGEHPFEGR